MCLDFIVGSCNKKNESVQKVKGTEFDNYISISTSLSPED